MYIYFSEESPNWDPKKQVELCREMIKETGLPYRNHLRPLGDYEEDPRLGNDPYITNNCFVDGVYIRRVTHLSDEEHNRILEISNSVYERVMKGVK